MRIIFDCETEIGKCDDSLVEDNALTYGEDRTCILYAQTAASLTSAKGMLKIEHRCYLRLGQEMTEQAWVKPEISLEPASGTEPELIAMVRGIHDQFIRKAREQVPESCLVD